MPNGTSAAPAGPPVVVTQKGFCFLGLLRLRSGGGLPVSAVSPSGRGPPAGDSQAPSQPQASPGRQARAAVAPRPRQASSLRPRGFRK
jgi:hypothetical protein